MRRAGAKAEDVYRFSTWAFIWETAGINVCCLVFVVLQLGVGKLRTPLSLSLSGFFPSNYACMHFTAHLVDNDIYINKENQMRSQ